MKKIALFVSALASIMIARADVIDVKEFIYAGPYELKTPVMLDSVDVNKNVFELKSILDDAAPLSSIASGGKKWSGVFAPVCTGSDALHTLSFCISNCSLSKTTVSVKGIKDYKTYIDGKVIHGEQSLEPALHQVVIKYISRKDESMDSLKVSVAGNNVSVSGTDLKEIGGRPYTIYDVMLGERYSGVSISPNGKYVIYSKSNTSVGGSVSYMYYVKEVSTGKILDTRKTRINWMPRTNKYYYTKSSIANGLDKDATSQMVVVDPITRNETVLASGIPTGTYMMSPTEDFLIVTTYKQGPKENPDVYEVISPDDRQPGYRTRSGLAKFDLMTGILQPLTFGFHNVNLCDISLDGKYALIMKLEENLLKRPTTLYSIYRLNIETMELETIIDKDGFVSGAIFCADGKGIVVQGSPECLAGIGNAVKDGNVPSMYDYQLYLMTKNAGIWEAEPLTKDFNPSVQSMQLSPSDGMVYFTAEDKDCVHLYQLNIKTHKITKINEPEDIVSRISVASNTCNIAMYGQGAMNSDRMYVIDTRLKGGKSTMIDNLSSDKLKDVKLGECKPWSYINENGDTVCCRYYLPSNFDATKKYPMIVNYYGGCSPTGRNFESRYPHHAYAALGYVVLVVNPRGASGFGQQWSAQHVNTAGKGPAEDIIGATKTFCKEHLWVNDKKIGCIGASYGGFMTQYLQTVTDIFAAAISHAGISDHTSYWGFGYWGYSYSEVSMANSYPWTRKDLFVEQSPLYNADKVHTPLLFVHGDADTNVPVNESIQMYTALKLLGRETAMVLVKDQNHHILDYEKRIKWQNTIWAWFAKWLQDDASWWDSMYGTKAL